MKIFFFVVVLGFSLSDATAYAATAPFCALGTSACAISAFNVVALGYTKGADTYDATTKANASVTGNVVGPTGADVVGRIAAAGALQSSLSNVGAGVATGSTTDPWASYSGGYAIWASGGTSSAATQIQVGGGGNVYAPGSKTTFNMNDHETVKTTTLTGSTPLPTTASGWSALSSLVISESTYLATLGQDLATAVTHSITTYSGNHTTGVVATLGTVSGGSIYGGVDLILNCNGATLCVFNLTAAQFNDTTYDNIDIYADSGTTVIINVAGTKLVLGEAIKVNGSQETDAVGSNILFNFYEANSVTINAQYDASTLAPMALLSGTGQMGGTFVVASVGSTGEIHNVEYTGTIPTTFTAHRTPEPSSLVLLGSGILCIAGLARRKLKS